jgi:plastocyanin
MRALAWLAASGIVVLGSTFAEATAPRTHTVRIANMQFDPQTVNVRSGDRVDWVNEDPFPHTASATAGAFDSKAIAANASWSYVAGKAGEYAYACTYHPTMQGKLIVQ